MFSLLSSYRRRLRRGVTALALCVLATAGCTYSFPHQALTTTTPLAGEGYLAYAEVEGRACISLLLFVLPLSGDASIHRAKQRAIESATDSREVDGLLEVTIDTEVYLLPFYRRICTIVRGRPFRYQREKVEQTQPVAVAEEGRPAPQPDKRAGRGVVRYDRFKKQRVFEWRDVYLATGKKRGLFLGLSAMTEELGRRVSADELSVQVLIEARPNPARLAECRDLSFLADDAPVSADAMTFHDGLSSARLSFTGVERLAAAGTIEGRVCGEEFKLDDAQRKQLRAFVKAIRNRVAPAPSAPAPDAP